MERARGRDGVLEVSIFLGKLGFALSITPVNVHWTKPSVAHPSHILPCTFRVPRNISFHIPTFPFRLGYFIYHVTPFLLSNFSSPFSCHVRHHSLRRDLLMQIIYLSTVSINSSNPKLTIHYSTPTPTTSPN